MSIELCCGCWHVGSIFLPMTMPSFNFIQLARAFACHFTAEEHLELGRIVGRIVKMIKSLVAKRQMLFLYTENPEHLNNSYDLFQ